MPRRYRGMDIFWWLESTGRLARTIDEVPDPAAARREPSLQLVGRNDASTVAADLDLATLQRRGVRLAGRLRRRSTGRTAQLRGRPAPRPSRPPTRRCTAFLDASTGTSSVPGLDQRGVAGRPARAASRSGRPRRPRPAAEGIGTVLLATGYRPDHPWLRLPITGRDGALRQHRGVTAAPGVYVVGQRFQHRRDSGFIDGARHDARAVVDHLLTGSAAAERRLDDARGAGGMNELRRRRGRRPGRRRLHRDAARPRGRPGRAPRPRAARQRHRCPRTALMRAGVLQLSRWGLLDRGRRRRHARRCAAPSSTTSGGEPVQVSIRPTPGSTRSTRRAVTCSTGSSSTRPRRPAPRCCTRPPSTGLLRDGDGRVARRACRRAAAVGRVTDRRRRSPWAPTASARWSPTRSARAGRAAGARGERGALPLLRRLPGRRLRVGVRRRAGRRADPHQRRADLRLRRHHPGRGCGSCGGTGREAAFDDPARHRRARRVAGAGPHAAPWRTRMHGWARRARARAPVVGAGLGAGRGRRLLQGPDHHPRHDRRAARRRAAGRRAPRDVAGGGRAGGGGAGALPGDPGPALRPAVRASTEEVGDVRLGHRARCRGCCAGSAPR